jgi:serine/threonine-protein kinase
MDPIVVADVVLDAVLASDAEAVRIAPVGDGYAIAIARSGELIASSRIDDELARNVIARLGYVCESGRTRVRSAVATRDIVLTIIPGERPTAELVVLRGDAVIGRELAEGDRVGHYKIVAPIGAGGMGDVYEAVHEKLGRHHALKVLSRRVHEQDQAFVERFELEAQAAARLRSPHIVEIYDFGYLPDRRPYIVMDLLGGASLADVLIGGPLPLGTVVSIGRQLAEALATAHGREVIHGDVTPSNILIDDGHVTLIDFGLARLRPSATTEPAREVIGTPRYIAPEQVRGYQTSMATDQYAFGIVMYEMITGEPPFAGETTRDTCLAHLGQAVPAIESPYGAVSPRLVSLVTRCLAKHPMERFPSMRALASHLASLVEVAS